LKLKPFLLRGIALVLIAVISYSAYQLWGINRNYAQEAEMHSRIQQYSPVLRASSSSDSHVPDEEPVIVNQSIIDLQARYPDVVGWLTIPNTQIDYPFVRGNDNDYYLHLDLDQNWSSSGTIFMDYRNSKDFSDFNTIIFGHNMRNGSMFGTLQNFNDQNFFDTNRTGTIFLANKTYEVEFIAFAVVKLDDAIVYNPNISTETDKITFLDHVKNIARHYRDVDITANDRIITLSTCNYEFNDARMVLIGRILP
jgi:sortase B